jgi:hypothetical protein
MLHAARVLCSLMLTRSSFDALHHDSASWSMMPEIQAP